jgi:hypothetical protein
MQALGLVWDDVDNLVADADATYTRLSEPRHFGARLALEAWRTQRLADGFVVGRDVPSRALAPVLRNLAVYEPLDGGCDFRARLAGSALIRRFGCDVTGLKLSELFDREAFEHHRAVMAEVLASQTPRSLDVQIKSESRTQLRFEVLSLPVLAPDRETGWLLTGLFYHDWTR